MVFALMYACVLCMCLGDCKAKKGQWISGNGCDGSEQLCGYWELNPDSLLEEQGQYLLYHEA